MWTLGQEMHKVIKVPSLETKTNSAIPNGKFSFILFISRDPEMRDNPACAHTPPSLYLRNRGWAVWCGPGGWEEWWSSNRVEECAVIGKRRFSSGGHRPATEREREAQMEENKTIQDPADGQNQSLCGSSLMIVSNHELEWISLMSHSSRSCTQLEISIQSKKKNKTQQTLTLLHCAPAAHFLKLTVKNSQNNIFPRHQAFHGSVCKLDSVDLTWNLLTDQAPASMWE